jgi:hypothetical protein
MSQFENLLFMHLTVGFREAFPLRGKTCILMMRIRHFIEIMSIWRIYRSSVNFFIFSLVFCTFDTFHKHLFTSLHFVIFSCDKRTYNTNWGFLFFIRFIMLYTSWWFSCITYTDSLSILSSMHY